MKADETGRINLFQSTPSARRTAEKAYGLEAEISISIHALREEDGPAQVQGGISIVISIHALREEDGVFLLRDSERSSNFNPRPPRGGRPKPTSNRPNAEEYFNPRPPRGGRLYDFSRTLPARNFNPRPPRGGRPVSYGLHSSISTISIHALREEDGAPWSISIGIDQTDFNPRPPRGGRPDAAKKKVNDLDISIHALREEDGGVSFDDLTLADWISIHALREEDGGRWPRTTR